MLHRLTGWQHRQAHEIAGALYLLHAESPIGNFDNPLALAQHYLGFAEGEDAELYARVSEHGGPHGAKIMLAFARANIRWVVARTWRGISKAEEIRMKRSYKSARKVCPVCRQLISFEELAALPLADQLGVSAEAAAAGAAAALLTDFDHAARQAGGPDWLEIKTLQDWRAARTGQPRTLPDDWDAGLL